MRDIADSLALAFDRLDDFRRVQAEASLEELHESVMLLQSAVGIEDGSRSLIRDRLEELDGKTHAGHVLLGVIVGLFAAGFETQD